MDLSISPDIEAWYCYLIVLVFGLFTAWRQISERLRGFQGIWTTGSAWLLLLLYIAVSLVLFWLLDRTGAIHDTSLFAALVVGLGYDRILAGSNASLQLDAEMTSTFWSPFLAFADDVAESVRKRTYRRQLRVHRSLTKLFDTQLMTPKEGEPDLLGVVRELSSDVQTLNTELTAIDAVTGLDERTKRGRKTERLVEEVEADDDYLFELRRHGVIDGMWYHRHSPQSVNRLVTACVALLVAILAGIAWWKLDGSRLELAYDTWRLGKTDITAVERQRVRRNFDAHLADSMAAGPALDAAVRLLRSPELPVSQTDLILAILVEQRCRDVIRVKLPRVLTQGLHANSVDTRGRIHRVLCHLADPDSGTCPVGDDWEPSDGDSVMELQAHIDEWQRYWASHPLAGCG